MHRVSRCTEYDSVSSQTLKLFALLLYLSSSFGFLGRLSIQSKMYFLSSLSFKSGKVTKPFFLPQWMRLSFLSRERQKERRKKAFGKNAIVENWSLWLDILLTLCCTHAMVIFFLYKQAPKFMVTWLNTLFIIQIILPWLCSSISKVRVF